MQTRNLAIVALLLGQAIWLASVRAEEDQNSALRKELAKAARTVSTTLKLKKLKSIGIPIVNGPSNRPRGGGEENIRRIFIGEIRKHKIEVGESGDAGVTIVHGPTLIRDPLDKDRLRAGTQLKVTIEQGDDQLDKSTYQFIGLVDMVHQEALNGTFLASSVVDVEQKAVKLARAKAQTAIRGSMVLPDKDSPFGLEVLVKDKERQPRDKGGVALVNFEKGEVYTIRLINRSANEVAVRLTIDGVSIFAFSKLRHETGPRKGQPRLSAVLMPARSSVVVKGWHNTTQEMHQFKIGAYPDSAAARVGARNDARQTITASFAAAWPKDQLPPKDEPSRVRGSEGYGTVVGDAIKVSSKAVERKVGIVRAAVTVRYDVPKK